MPVVMIGHISALVVGGGPVATRKAAALLDGGAHVRVVAALAGDEMRELQALRASLHVIERPYRADDIGSAQLVIAATDDALVNASVALDATERGRLVNVADRSGGGTFVLPAVHRAGHLTIAVYAGGVPGAARRVRDAIAARFDARYGDAIEALRALRTRLLGQGHRGSWHQASDSMLDDRFCDAVESGTLVTRVDSWR